MNIVYYHVSIPGHYAQDIDYFQYSVLTTQRFNPGSVIYILGDENPKIKGTIFIDISELTSDTLDFFKEVYTHNHTNSESFERNCLYRWGHIASLMDELDLDNITYLDSDVMLLTPDFNYSGSINMYLDKGWYSNGMAGACPHVTVIKNRVAFLAILEYWDELLLDLKKNGKKSLLSSVKPKDKVGVSDMNLWAFANHTFSVYFESLKGIQTDGSVFDTAINQPEGFVMENGIKKLFKFGEKFFLQNEENRGYYRVNSLHFHGGSKKQIKDIYTKFL